MPFSDKQYVQNCLSAQIVQAASAHGSYSFDSSLTATVKLMATELQRGIQLLTEHVDIIFILNS